MIQSINDFNRVFFIGIAGTGMSAIAQYLQGIGKEVGGSDRYFHPDEPNDTKTKLEAEGIHCFLQDGSGIEAGIDLVVDGWYGLYAPAALPAELQQYISDAVQAVVPSMANALARTGLVAAVSTPSALTQMQQTESAFWAQWVKATGFKPED